jgi:hypothetical protein
MAFSTAALQRNIVSGAAIMSRSNNGSEGIIAVGN